MNLPADQCKCNAVLVNVAPPMISGVGSVAFRVNGGVDITLSLIPLNDPLETELTSVWLLWTYVGGADSAVVKVFHSELKEAGV